MTILFIGGEMGSVTPSDAGINEATTALGGAGASYDSAFARCYLNCVGSSSYGLVSLTAAQTDLWTHFDLDQYNASASATLRTVAEWLNASSVAKIRLQTSWSSDSWSMDWHNGSAWVNLGSWTADGETRQTLDFHFVVNSATGSANAYMSGTNRMAVTSVDFSTIASLQYLKLYGNTVAINGNNGVSQIIMATESTIGMRVMTAYAANTGSTDQWTGSYTSIDETVYSDADFIYTTAADQVEVFSPTLVGSLTGYVVRAVAVTARAKKDGTGPANIRMALRSNGTNYFSGSDIALDVAYGAHYTVWETDPNTSAAWTTAAASAFQFGVKSIT
jgi:hypothetical protein